MAKQIHLVDYFDSALSAFEQSFARSPDSFDAFIKLAETFVIRLRFSRADLAAAFMPTFEHLAVEPVKKPDCTLCIWDKSPKPPYPTWQGQSKFQYVDLLAGDRIKLTCEFEPQRLSAIDLERNIGLCWVSDMSQLPGWERCAPFRSLLHWWLGARGQHLVHAAAIGTSHGGVLIAGPGGSGKSSTALACLKPEFRFVGDDYCLIRIEDERATASSIYSCAKVDFPASRSRLSHLAPHMIAREDFHELKEVIYVQRTFPEIVVRQLPIKAVLVPRVTGELHTRLAHIEPVEAARALIPSTMKQLPGSEINSFFAMMSLTRMLPVYRLELGTDVSEIASVIADLLPKSNSRLEPVAR